jgi:LTXXQ motif family protein
MNRSVKRVLLSITVTAVVGVGAAYADRAGMMGGSFGRGPGQQFQRFCATDQAYISGRIANRLTERLKLTDPQKASLKDLQDTFIKAAADAKASCSETPDMATVVGRLNLAEKRTEAMLGLMKAVQPKLEAFYATLDDTQKADFNQMGPRGRFLHPRWHPGDDRSAPEHG